MDVNDNARHQTVRVILVFFASKLAPTQGAGVHPAHVHQGPIA
jgi:hypothetical protein